jgi:hypothetical protein
MAKNCHTCQHLEWVDDDSTDGWPGDDGWICPKRDDGGQNAAVLKQLKSDAYRARYKRCFEQKGPAA